MGVFKLFTIGFSGDAESGVAGIFHHHVVTRRRSGGGGLLLLLPLLLLDGVPPREEVSRSVAGCHHGEEGFIPWTSVLGEEVSVDVFDFFVEA